MSQEKKKGTDPAFLFYPGSASEDTQFMNRLERGAYFDLLKAQKKFAKFTLEMLKKVLGQDFESCWPAIEMVLTKEGEYYFIKWVADAIQKRKEHTELQTKRIKEYWQKKKNTENNPPINPGINQGNSTELPLENVIVNENEIKNTNENRKGVQGETENIDFSKPDIDGDLVIFPIDSKPVRELWANWKKYRWNVHNARYKLYGEQADLKRLEQMDFKQVEETILSAMANNWKNLYPDKNKTNGYGTSKNKQQQHTDSLIADFAARRGSASGK